MSDEASLSGGLQLSHVRACSVCEGRAIMLQPGEVDRVINSSYEIHRAQAYGFMDRLIASRDPVTGLLPLHVKTDRGTLVAADHQASGLDMGRATSGLVMLSDIARAEGDGARADAYLTEAEDNYDRGQKLLAERDYFVHGRDFDDKGNLRLSNIGVPGNTIGEPGKSAAGEDNMSRVNTRAYAIRAIADLYRATGRDTHKQDFARYLAAWVRDFHAPLDGGFFIHANVADPSDHKEIGTFKDPGGAESKYEWRRGIKGNDGTIYALPAVLLLANEVLATEQTQRLVKEQLDIIFQRFHRLNGMLWESYTSDWYPISVDSQNQPVKTAGGHSVRTSHVAIGGHTAMAPQQVIEGARQLLAQRSISEAEYFSYIDQSVSLFQKFVTDAGAVNWTNGAVYNGVLVEVEEKEHRRLRDWAEAGWQQAELIQTLLRFREEDRLRDIVGPTGKTGEDLLQLAERRYVTKYPVPAEYVFTGFGNPDVYHRPQLAHYHRQALCSLANPHSADE
jgi:hypothetical protein